MVTEVGPVDIEVPRDRDGTFEPKIVGKRQRRLDGIDELVLSSVPWPEAHITLPKTREIRHSISTPLEWSSVDVMLVEVGDHRQGHPAGTDRLTPPGSR